MKPSQKQTQRQPHFSKDSAKKSDFSAKNDRRSVSRSARVETANTKKSAVNSDNKFLAKPKAKPVVKASNQPKVEGEKLQKVLARAGQGSRREIETMIAAGRVSVEGKIATLGDRIDVHSGVKVRIDGQIINLSHAQKEICRVLMYYKPEGELCTRSDPEGRATVFDRLLFTTDGELANRLMHPSREVEREYSVRVFGQVDDAMLARLRKGVQLEDGPANFKEIKFTGGVGINQWYDVTLMEGRNREVRRLWESQGIQVSRLIRIRYGNIKLMKGLPRGGWEEMDLENVNYLRELVGLPAETETKLDVTQPRRRPKSGQIRKAVKRYSELSKRYKK